MAAQNQRRWDCTRTAILNDKTLKKIPTRILCTEQKYMNRMFSMRKSLTKLVFMSCWKSKSNKSDCQWLKLFAVHSTYSLFMNGVHSQNFQNT